MWKKIPYVENVIVDFIELFIATATWMLIINGTQHEFDQENNEILEESFNKDSKTKLVMFSFVDFV